ncbi:MAG: hypothetical protein JST11_03360 [Acidobacteria bacterium]|nr:hypothetical protein [Acidobacteriota bacterium]
MRPKQFKGKTPIDFGSDFFGRFSDNDLRPDQDCKPAFQCSGEKGEELNSVGVGAYCDEALKSWIAGSVRWRYRSNDQMPRLIQSSEYCRQLLKLEVVSPKTTFEADGQISTGIRS